MPYLHRGESRFNELEIRVKCINSWLIIVARSIDTAIRISTVTSPNTVVYGPFMCRKVTVNSRIQTVSFDLRF